MAKADKRAPIYPASVRKLGRFNPFRPNTLAGPRRLKASLKHVLMPEMDIITDGGRRRRWSQGQQRAPSKLSGHILWHGRRVTRKPRNFTRIDAEALFLLDLQGKDVRCLIANDPD